jgi:hypothetical protein
MLGSWEEHNTPREQIKNGIRAVNNCARNFCVAAARRICLKKPQRWRLFWM